MKNLNGHVKKTIYGKYHLTQLIEEVGVLNVKGKENSKNQRVKKFMRLKSKDLIFGIQEKKLREFFKYQLQDYVGQTRQRLDKFPGGV